MLLPSSVKSGVLAVMESMLEKDRQAGEEDGVGWHDSRLIPLPTPASSPLGQGQLEASRGRSYKSSSVRLTIALGISRKRNWLLSNQILVNIRIYIQDVTKVKDSSALGLKPLRYYSSANQCTPKTARDAPARFPSQVRPQMNCCSTLQMWWQKYLSPCCV